MMLNILLLIEGQLGLLVVHIQEKDLCFKYIPLDILLIYQNTLTYFFLK